MEILHGPGSSDAAAAVLTAGADNVTIVTDTLLVADVPFEALEAVQALPEVEFVRVPVQLNAPPEPLEPEGDLPGEQTGPRAADILSKTKAKSWHAAGITGKGVKVGIIDYFHAGYWNAAVAAGEIKASQPKGTFCRNNGADCASGFWNTGTPHGTAVAEVIQDMAPGADLYLATANTTADTKAAVDYFRGKGVKIISRSLAAAMDGPGNGTGPADDVLNYAVSKGITWFNSAGNHGVKRLNSGDYAGGYWRGKWQDTDADGWLEFTDPRGIAPSAELVPVDCTYFQGLRWNDWGANRTDYDLCAFSSASATTLIASSENNQVAGAPPLEGDSFNSINCSAYPYYWVAVRLDAAGNGSAGDILEIMLNGALYYYAPNAYSATQPFADTKNPGGAAVGAVDPVDGKIIATYSSRGSSNDGRIKPNISAGSNMLSHAYGGRFNGTSAATPVVAGAAALLLQFNPKLKPAQVVSFLTKQATIDRGAKGPDNTYGTGELAFKAYASVPTIKGTGKAGKKLTAQPGKWGPRSKVTFKYQWYRNGKAIAGAKSKTYKLVKADKGKQIKVKVTGSQKGFAAISKTSAAKKVKK